MQVVQSHKILPEVSEQTLMFYHFFRKGLRLYVYSRTQVVVSAQKRLEVTSSAIHVVVLSAFLDSPNLPKEGLSGLKGKFSWRDA